MFERFTERARQVIVLARQEAGELGHETCEPEHILLGLLAEEGGLAARVLGGLGVELEPMRKLAAKTAEQKENIQNPPLSKASKTIADLALREALSLGHNYIGTEHILLGLMRQDNGAVRLLALKQKVSTERVGERVRGEVLLALHGPRISSKAQLLEEGRKLITKALAALDSPENRRRGSYASVLEQLAATATTGARYLRGR